MEQDDTSQQVHHLLQMSGTLSVTPSKQDLFQNQTQKTQFRIAKPKIANFLSPSAQNLINAKEEKKQAESNLLALQTRVQLLKLQDQKNQKQIKQTKQKTFSIIQSKTRSYLDKQLLLYHYEKMQQSNDVKADLIRQQRKREQIGIEDRKAYLQEKREKEINFQYEIKQQMQRGLIVRQQKQDLEKQCLYNTVKNHEYRLDVKKKTMEEFKLKVTEQNYKERVDLQLREALNTQMQLEMMEQQEHLALKQLQSTQNLQRVAIQEIKTLIQSPSSRSQNVRQIYNL